jgi:VWFA-related protein
MHFSTSSGFAFLVLALCSTAATAQPAAPASPPPSGRMVLDVVVTPKSGAPVSGLQQQDFTILDNKAPQTIASFAALGGPQAPIEVVVLIDTVNAGLTTVTYERAQIDKFFKADGGHLAYPTSLAIFDDAGVSMGESPTKDGNLLSAALAQSDLGLRTIHRDTGVTNDADRVHLSLIAAQKLAVKEAARPGRKIVVWVSPGWPLLSFANLNFDAQQNQQLFHQTVVMNTLLRRAGITLYSINPVGSTEGVHQLDYEAFLKGAAKVSQGVPAYLALQVMAIQSGGLALTGSNDIAGELEHCMTDFTAYYELSFDPPPGDRPDDLHTLQVKVSQPDVTARTRTIYYSQPSSSDSRMSR